MQNSESLVERVGALDARLNELEARVSLIERAPDATLARPTSAPKFAPLLLPKPATPASASANTFAPEATNPASFSPPAQPKAADATASKVAPQTLVASAPMASAAPARPSFGGAAPSKSGDSLLDWEQLVGGKWALWAGLLSLFCAMASFLAYSWRFLPPPPPGAKVAMGLAAGAAFLVVGEWMRARAQRWFGEGLSGAGLALCFLSLWAGAAFFSIFPIAPTFVGMALLVALGVWLALRHDAPSLHILSVIGGFATPILLQGQGGAGGDSSLALLSYLAILNAGVVGASLFKRWRGAIWLSATATVVTLAMWSSDAPIDSMRGAVWAFLSVYFLLYVGAACFYSLARGEETAPADAALLLGASALYAVWGHFTLLPLLGEFPSAFALGMALFFGVVCAATARFAPANLMLRQGAGALGLLALTVAVPIQFGQPWLGIGWAGEAGVLLWLSRRQNSEFWRRAGRAVWVTSLIPLILGMLEGGGAVHLGLHAGGWPWLFGLALAAWHAGAAHRQSEDESDQWKDFYALFGVAGGAWLVAREVALAAGGANQIWLVLLALCIYAVAVFGVGARARFAAVRLCAVALAAGAAALALWWTGQHWSFDLTPFWNWRWAALSGSLGALGAIYAGARAVDFPLDKAEKKLARAWPLCAFGYALSAASVELYLGFGHFGAPDWASRAFFALAILWICAALWLLWRGLQARDGARRAVAYFVGALAVAALVVNALATSAGWLPFANWRGGAFGATIVALCIAAWWLKRASDQEELLDWEGEMPTLLAGGALALTLWVLTQETWEAGRYFAGGGDDWQRGAQLAISLVWSLFGALLLLGGIGWRVQLARLGALALLAATVCKVFLFDLSFLGGDLRALSLGGLGVSLVFISWLYGRFGRAKVAE